MCVHKSHAHTYAYTHVQILMKIHHMHLTGAHTPHAHILVYIYHKQISLYTYTTCTNSCAHTSHTQTLVHNQMHTSVYIHHIHKHLHTYRHAYTFVHMSTLLCTYITYTNICTHIPHAYTFVHIHICVNCLHFHYFHIQ